LEMGLLVSDDDVDVIGALQTVVHDLLPICQLYPLASGPFTYRSQAVGVRGKVDPRDIL
jgi:hypothetical protein